MFLVPGFHFGFQAMTITLAKVTIKINTCGTPVGMLRWTKNNRIHVVDKGIQVVIKTRIYVGGESEF